VLGSPWSSGDFLTPIVNAFPDTTEIKWPRLQ